MTERNMAGLTLLDLVNNGTMDAEVAATLSFIAEEKRSFMVVAIPSGAGKSTTTQAMLDFVPDSVPVHHLSGSEAEMEGLRLRPDGGYLVVAEISPWVPRPNYIWGPKVRKVFLTLRAGYSLAVCLHAPTVEDAYDEVCRGNGIGDEDASRITYMVYIECVGSYWEDLKRRVAAVYEVERVVDGVPRARLLHRWDRRGDRFERMEHSKLLSTSAQQVRKRAERIRQLVDAGRTSEADVEALKK